MNDAPEEKNLNFPFCADDSLTEGLEMLALCVGNVALVHMYGELSLTGSTTISILSRLIDVDTICAIS